MQNSTSLHFHAKPFRYEIPSNVIFCIPGSSMLNSRFSILDIIEYSLFKVVFIALGKSLPQEPGGF